MSSPGLSELMPLRLALYGPNAPLSGMRRREVREEIGPIVKRKSRYSPFRKEYILIDAVKEYLKKHGNLDDLQGFV